MLQYASLLFHFLDPFLSTDVLMVNFSPDFENLENQVPCEFVIIIDCSGKNRFVCEVSITF